MASAWRIVNPRYSSEILSGVGAARYPGRWNFSGEPLIYAAGSQALTQLERLVYMVSPFPDMIIGEISFPGKYIEQLELDENEISAVLDDRETSRQIGSGWIKSELSIALAVPSVHIHPSSWTDEPNILINPLHPDFKRVRLKRHFKFSYDARLEI